MYSEKHKPVACIVEAKSRVEFALKQEPYQKAIIAICAKRSWTVQDLLKFGYTKWQVRKAEV